MKNIQVIDGADNCTYSIFSIDDEKFEMIFPNGRDVEFIGDLEERLSLEQMEKVFEGLWERCVKKTEVTGIHGTLFYELEFKKKYYPTKKEEDMLSAQETWDSDG